MSNEKESVINFLTPTKLIAGSLRQPKPKSNTYQSMYTNSPNQYTVGLAENQSNNYNSQFQKVNYKAQSSIQNNQTSGLDTLEAKQRNIQFGKNHALENTGKVGLKSENHFQTAQDKTQTRSLEIPIKTGYQLHKVQQAKVKDYQDDYIMEKIGSSGHNSRVKASYRIDEPIEGQQSRGLQKSSQWLSALIQQLKGVKDTIDVSLAQLQNLLDNTSKFLNDIDAQYAHIKQRVLDYTSQVLDAGFTKYKQNMVQWAKYEDVERRALLVTQQLKTTIQQEQINQQTNRVSKGGSRVAMGKQQQLIQKLSHFEHFSNQMQAVKIQCVNMRPQLKKSKIIIFEQAISALSDF